MDRGRNFMGPVKLGLLSAALVTCLSMSAQAGDNKLAFTGSASFVTDYMFRSISNTNQNPAVQPEFDLTYGIFFAGIWGSNTAFGENIEIDYYGGIAPKWGDVTFNITALEYTYLAQKLMD